MLQTIFFDKPVLLLFLAGIILLHTLYFAFKSVIFQIANVGLHLCAILVFFEAGAYISDILFTLLISILTLLIFKYTGDKRAKGADEK